MEINRTDTSGNSVRLTRLAGCAGCGAKVGAGVLSKLLTGLPVKPDPNLLVGFDTSDDACVYRIDDHTAIVQTLDFFPPIVDDPFMFGQIAACNALSDIYAMGGTPKLALNIMTFANVMPDEAVREILRGGYEKAAEADTIICGGHTIHDESPKYGLSVTGFVDPGAFFSNASSRVGDILILTKPLGIGILTTAAKAGLAKAPVMTKITAQMATLNRAAAEIILTHNRENPGSIHSCTDVTGFGLMGHAFEMASGSGTTIHITASTVRRFEEAELFASMGFVPDGAYKNRDYVGSSYRSDADISRELTDILFDPQTSGGLLVAADEKTAPALLSALCTCCDAFTVGYVTNRSDTVIVIE